VGAAIGGLVLLAVAWFATRGPSASETEHAAPHTGPSAELPAAPAPPETSPGRGFATEATTIVPRETSPSGERAVAADTPAPAEADKPASARTSKDLGPRTKRATPERSAPSAAPPPPASQPAPVPGKPNIDSLIDGRK
jgi:hypothetical protein